MRFSIIIPVYNVEQYLEKCLHSVLDQDYNDYEILLINDGSKDASGDICQEYALKYSRIHYEYQENAGPSAARNRGIQLAKGDYLIFLDSDDEIENGALQRLSEIIGQTDVDGIISSEKIKTSADGEPVEEPLRLDMTNIQSSKRSALMELSKKRFSPATHKVVIKREVFVRSGLAFDTNYCVGEDLLLMTQAICQCGSFRLNTCPYYIYNYNDTSIMRTISFDRIWQTTGICSSLFEISQSVSESERDYIFTVISMLLIGFTKYYCGFSPDQKKQTDNWMNVNKHILNAVVDTLPATSLAKKFIGTRNAFLLAGFAASRQKAR